MSEKDEYMVGSDEPVPVSFFVPQGPVAEPSVQSGYLVIWTGRPGPATALKVRRLTDTDGTSAIVPLGEAPFPVTVVDDEDD